MLKKLCNALPITLQSLLLRIAILLLLMTVTRIVFYFFNVDSFAHLRFTDWFAGIWFDLSTIGLLLMPFIVLSLLPEKWQHNWPVRILQALTFFIPVLLIIALNLMDTAYYNFTLKRSTADLFVIVSAGNDVGQLLTSFISDYWMLILIFIAGTWLLIRYYKRTSIRRLKRTTPSSLRKELIAFFFVVPLFVLFGRGGFALRPISPLDATLYTQPENSALVLNSAFTLLKSIGKEDFKVSFSGGTLASINSVLARSDALTVLPYSVVFLSRKSAGLEALQIKIEHPDRQLGFLTHDSATPPPALRRFADFLKDEFNLLEARIQHESQVTRRRG